MQFLDIQHVKLTYVQWFPVVLHDCMIAEPFSFRLIIKILVPPAQFHSEEFPDPAEITWEYE